MKPVLPERRQFNGTKHDFEMTLNEYSMIVEDEQVGKLELSPPVYTSISDVPGMDENAIISKCT